MAFVGIVSYDNYKFALAFSAMLGLNTCLNLLPNSTSEHQGSRMELRRSSFYSTLDLLPQLEHYASTLPHSKSRPSLEALRRAFEVSYPPLQSTSQSILQHID